MSRILCLDSVSQVHPTSVNFITRSFRKFSGLSIKPVLSPERLQKHSPKNLLFVEPHLNYCPTLSTLTPIFVIHKYNLTVVSNSYFSFAVDTENSATSTMNVSPTSNICLGPELSQYVAKFAVLVNQMLCSYWLSLLQVHYKLFRVLDLQDKVFVSLCPFHLLPLLYLQKKINLKPQLHQCLS